VSEGWAPARESGTEASTRANVRIVGTPLAPLALPRSGVRPRKIAPDVIASALPGPGRDRLANGDVLVVTTGQQPGLFTGPLYTIYKALSAIALAARLERAQGGGAAVVPVFWVAGDDHDFAEASHASFFDARGDLAEVRLRERPAEGPLVPMAREPCGPEVHAALARLRAELPDSEFKDDVLAWLAAAYQPDATLADAFAEALHALLGARGLVVLRPYDRRIKQLAAPALLESLGVTLPDGYTPVLLEARLGRDRLRADGDGFVTRRSGERFTRDALERIARNEPDRLSPNVLLRPALEAVLLPTVAYAAGPAELQYLPDAAPLYGVVAKAGGAGVVPQAPVPRWSGVLVDARVEKLMARYGLSLDDLSGRPGDLETRLVRETLPPEAQTRFNEVRRALEEQYGRLGEVVEGIDPTLARPVQSARNSAVSATRDIERKLLSSLKKDNEALVRQIARARASVFPRGEAQERIVTVASFLARFGPSLIDQLAQEVARWADAS